MQSKGVEKIATTLISTLKFIIFIDLPNIGIVIVVCKTTNIEVSSAFGLICFFL